MFRSQSAQSEKSPLWGGGRIHIYEKSPVTSRRNSQSDSDDEGHPMLGGYRHSYGGTNATEGNGKADGRRSAPMIDSSDRTISALDRTKDVGATSPPLIKWVWPALICALAYAFYNIFIKMGSASIHPVLGGVVLQFVAAALGTVLIGILVWKEGADELFCDKTGMKFATLAGIGVGMAEIISFIVSGMGVQAVQSIPIIIGGCILFGSLLGLLMLKETMTLQGWVGIGLLVVGIALVATDPGPKVFAE